MGPDARASGYSACLRFRLARPRCSRRSWAQGPFSKYIIMFFIIWFHVQSTVFVYDSMQGPRCSGLRAIARAYTSRSRVRPARATPAHKGPSANVMFSWLSFLSEFVFMFNRLLLFVFRCKAKMLRASCYRVPALRARACALHARATPEHKGPFIKCHVLLFLFLTCSIDCCCLCFIVRPQVLRASGPREPFALGPSRPIARGPAAPRASGAYDGFMDCVFRSVWKILVPAELVEAWQPGAARAQSNFKFVLRFV